MTALPTTDLEQTVYARQRAVRRLVTSVRALPAQTAPRTDVPLAPVPFAERMASPLWASLADEPMCIACHQIKPAEAFSASRRTWREDPDTWYLPTRKCNACKGVAS